MPVITPVLARNDVEPPAVEDRIARVDGEHHDGAGPLDPAERPRERR